MDWKLELVAIPVSDVEYVEFEKMVFNTLKEFGAP